MSSPRKPTFLFTAALCAISAAFLATLSVLLQPKQQLAIEVYKSKQLLQAALILDSSDHFLLTDRQGSGFAKYSLSSKTLLPSKVAVKASSSTILAFFQNHVTLQWVDNLGDLHAKPLDKTPTYPLYTITETDKVIAYIIPIDGFGLWDAIHGYLAIRPDGNTVIGTSWYEQKETPGLGGDIALHSWQKQFFNKVIFQPDNAGETHFSSAPLGIYIVKGRVENVLGKAPKAKNAVDGVAGASITMQGVSQAYKESLAPYRPFLIKAHKRWQSEPKP